MMKWVFRLEIKFIGGDHATGILYNGFFWRAKYVLYNTPFPRADPYSGKMSILANIFNRIEHDE